MVYIIATTIISFLIGYTVKSVKSQYKQTFKPTKRKPIEQTEEKEWAAETSKSNQNAIPLNLLK